MISGVVQFEQAVFNCPDGPLQKLWSDYKERYSPLVASQGVAHQIFSTALKVTQSVLKQEALKNLWVDLLKASSFTLKYPEGPSHQYSFSSLVQLAAANAYSFDVKIAKVDKQNDDVGKLAEEVDAIAQEALGLCLGVEYNKNAILSPNNLSLVAKCGEETVGIVSASYITIAREENQAINVLHFSLAVRKADYPSIHLIQLVEGQKSCILEQFPDTDYLSLCTREDNEHALLLYDRLGFVLKERKEKGFQGKPTVFFLLRLPKGRNKPTPTYDEVQEARSRERQKQGFMKSPSDKKQEQEVHTA